MSNGSVLSKVRMQDADAVGRMSLQVPAKLISYSNFLNFMQSGSVYVCERVCVS